MYCLASVNAECHFVAPDTNVCATTTSLQPIAFAAFTDDGVCSEYAL